MYKLACTIAKRRTFPKPFPTTFSCEGAGGPAHRWGPKTNKSLYLALFNYNFWYTIFLLLQLLLLQ